MRLFWLTFCFFRDTLSNNSNIETIGLFSGQNPDHLVPGSFERICHGTNFSQELNVTLKSNMDPQAILKRTADCNDYFDNHITAAALEGYEFMLMHLGLWVPRISEQCPANTFTLFDIWRFVYEFVRRVSRNIWKKHLSHFRQLPKVIFPLAFGILIHHQVGLFELFMASSFKPGDSVCVHVDKNAWPNTKKVRET